MKKWISMAAVLLMCLVVLTGCGGDKSKEKPAVEAQPEDLTASEEAVKQYYTAVMNNQFDAAYDLLSLKAKETVTSDLFHDYIFCMNFEKPIEGFEIADQGAMEKHYIQTNEFDKVIDFDMKVNIKDPDGSLGTENYYDMQCFAVQENQDGKWRVYGQDLIAAAGKENAYRGKRAKIENGQLLPESQQDETAPEKENSSKISQGEFDQIQMGMTYEDVVNLVGGQGEVLSESEVAGYRTVVIQWWGEGSLGANANCMFQNNQVVSKSQFGLK